MFHKLSPIFSSTGSLNSVHYSYSCREILVLSRTRHQYIYAGSPYETDQSMRYRNEKKKNGEDAECNKERHFFPPQFPISLCPINLMARDIINKCLQDVVKQRKNSILFISRYCLTFKSDIRYPRQLSSWPTWYQKPLYDFGMKSSTIKLTPFKESTKTIKRNIIGTNPLRGCNQ